MDITNASIVVTGGAGFLGSRVVEALRGHGARKGFVPRSRDYNLVQIDAIRRLLADARPDLVIHLAANVGGIGANSRNPGSFFYNNLMMGTQLIDESRKAGVAKIVLSATVCAYPADVRSEVNDEIRTRVGKKTAYRVDLDEVVVARPRHENLPSAVTAQRLDDARAETARAAGDADRCMGVVHALGVD